MTERIIIAGAGGQGIMLLGKVLAAAAMEEDKFVTWLPSYGAEVRGGTAYCMLVISDAPIGSPYVDRADTLIIMNAPSLARFGKRIEAKGLIILNSSLVPECKMKHNRVIWCRFSDAAIQLGNVKVANMVALGVYLKLKGIIKKSTVLKVMQEMAPPGSGELVKINESAIDEGESLI